MAANGAGLDARPEVTNTMISAFHHGAIKPTVLVRSAVRYALLALLCATALGMARHGAGSPEPRRKTEFLTIRTIP
jgi:hypothetical protein